MFSSRAVGAWMVGSIVNFQPVTSIVGHGAVRTSVASDSLASLANMLLQAFLRLEARSTAETKQHRIWLYIEIGGEESGALFMRTVWKLSTYGGVKAIVCVKS